MNKLTNTHQSIARFFYVAITCILLTACDSQPPYTDAKSLESSQITLRTASNYCEAAGSNLDIAKLNYSNACSLPRVDCDPIDGEWVCSSEKIGQHGPDFSSATNSQSCSATGNDLFLAKQAYAAACFLPRADCDPINGVWVCSSSPIDAMSIANEQPTMSPATPSVNSDSTCVAEGRDLDEAKRNFAAACSIERLDCDPVNGLWQCSGTQIGSAQPAAVVPQNEERPTTGPEEPVAIFTDWLNSADYQAEFDRLSSANYPVTIEARCNSNNGGHEYRGQFLPRPSSSFSYYSHHGLSEGGYATLSNSLLGQGYSNIYLQTALCNGSRLYQGTWVLD